VQQRELVPFVNGEMKTALLSTIAVTALLTALPALGQRAPKIRDEVLVGTHRSAGSRHLGQGNVQAIARETADALAGRIEQPFMAPTRSSFLAKWQPAANATGYRLDVSTSPAFDSYVGNYRDLDLGNVTSQIVTGLDRGTR